MEEITFPEIETLEDLLVNAVDNVFSTMLELKPIYKQYLSSAELKGNNSPFYALGTKDPLMVGSIGFTGEANGVVFIYIEFDVALEITSVMTGMDTAELKSESEIVKDVIGEICNMTIGNFKNGICDLGFNCRVTLPTVLRGNKIEVDSIQSAERYAFCFELFNHPLVIDLFVQKGGQ
ncbi:MAG: chemotaxis protein CheX [Opitutales bacterium]|nr:chemotaxis protein CheX [Opitutales bacterium]